MSDIDPYAAPQTDFSTPVQDYSALANRASGGLRFANLIIDYFAQAAVGFVVGLGLGIAGVLNPMTPNPLLEVGIGLGVLVGYYTVMEGVFGVTIGKLITRTKVVTEDGSKPGFGMALGRSLCRMIPFEAFSFLGRESRGWHDSITKSYVVKM